MNIKLYFIINAPNKKIASGKKYINTELKKINYFSNQILYIQFFI